VQIRKLDKKLGDLVELVDTDKVLVHVEDYQIIIDEDTKQIVPKSELQAKVDSGETKRVRAVPAVAGGDDFKVVVVIEGSCKGKSYKEASKALADKLQNALKDVPEILTVAVRKV